MKNETLIKSLLCLITALCFGTVIYYILGPSEGYMHSDCVDTMTWTYASIDSGKLFSDTFCYPYLLPFGSVSIFYPFAKIFGFSMLAQRLSMITFLLFFAASGYFVARQLKWSRNWSLTAVCVLLMTVSSSQKMREIFWEHIIHYSLGAFLAFVLLGLTFLFMNSFSENNFNFFNKQKKPCKKIIIYSVLIALWAFFSAFDGLTTLTLSILPAIAAMFFVALFDFKTKFFSKENNDLLFSFSIILFAALIGSLALKVIAGDISHGYGNAYSTISNSSEWSENIMKFLSQWTSLLGADYKSGKSITAPLNILAAIKMAGSFILFLVPVYALFIYNKLNRHEKIFLFFHWLMTGFILYGYVFGKLSAANWRLSPIVCSAVIINVCIWRHTLLLTPPQYRIAGLTASLVVISCVITMLQVISMPFDYGRDNNHHKAIELLNKNRLDYGYATYWNANILTLLADNKLKVREVALENGQQNSGWLNCDKLWYEDQPNQRKYFVLLSTSEYNKFLEENHPILDNISNIINADDWYILIKDENIF